MKLSNNIECLYEDSDIIVCYKPAGIAVQSANLRQKDMESILNAYLAPEKQQIYVVHRLDQPVEGILVFAKNKKAAGALTSQITRGSMKKIYLACCQITEKAEPLLETGIIHLEDYLIKDGRTNSSRVGYKGEKDAKQAVLDFEVVKLERENRQAVVRIDLKTGRHHQIRVQMANAGLPLCGDRKYNSQMGEDWTGQLALCAAELVFTHPKTGKSLKYTIKPTGF